MKSLNSRTGFRASVAVAGFFAAVNPSVAFAQCSDGTPPPCGVEIRRASDNPAFTPPPPEVRSRSFMVLPFRNIRALAEDEWLVEGSPALLGQALSQWRELTVVPEDRMYPALRRAGLTPGTVMDVEAVKLVARETGGWTVVTGEVMRIGSKLRVSSRAYDAVSGADIARVSAEASSEEEIQGVYAEIAAGILESVGLTASDFDLSSVTTNSLDALKAYSRGLRHYRRAELLQAKDAFLESVGLDSTFAMAYGKLAFTSITSVEDLLDPQNAAYSYLDRAVVLSGNLPERQRHLLQADLSILGGQFQRARELLSALIANDSNDVEALLALAELEVLDGIVVMDGATAVRRGSFNTAARLAKRSLMLDPARREAYSILVAVYQMAAGRGLMRGVVVGFSAEAASLAAHLNRMPSHYFLVLARDTLELLLVSNLQQADRDSMEALQERAAGVYNDWAQRWVGVAPDVALAQLNAAYAYETGEKYDLSLAALSRAESLGVEISFDNLAGRRMIILTKAGRYAEGNQIADSLLEAGDLELMKMVTGGMLEVGAWALNLKVLDGDFEWASSILNGFPGLMREQGLDSAQALDGTIGALCTLPSTEDFVVYRANIVAQRLGAMVDDEMLGRCGVAMIAAALGGSDSGLTRELGLRILEVADSLNGEGRTNEALTLAQVMFRETGDEAITERAREVLQNFLGTDPDNLSVVYQIGRLEFLVDGDLDLAERSFRRFLGEYGEGTGLLPRAAAHRRLGEVLEKKGDIDGARQELETSLELDPDFVPAQQALEKLNEGESDR